MLAVLSAPSCSAHTSGGEAGSRTRSDRSAEQALAEFGLAPPTLAEVRDYLGAARDDCRSPLAYSQAGLGACRVAQWYLAEQELARAETEYAQAVEARELMPRDTQRDHRALREYARQRWREGRDADCALVALDYAGGSGASIGQVECLSEQTRQRTETLRRR